ncbi:MAG: gamma-glutamyl-gamma-aminobutyrate hydrolase family protein [Anaerolineaceae bacterium]|nr:gamma-glutamyl-gamma-aminobutyrate hydrolase family protein [Anaerolineaceae bacterium]
MKPLIGITTASYTVPERGLYNQVSTGNIKAIDSAGGLPVLIPVHVGMETLRAIYEQVDGILLPGGRDVNPQRYHMARHALTQDPDDRRDEAELAIARWAVEEDRPLFAICRGHQLLNVALGGTLIQDIASETASPIIHSTPRDIPRNFIAHEVTINPESRLHDILGTEQTWVNSLHHQAVELVAPGLHVTAHAPDGIVEGLELPGKHFVLSVQWHPEDIYADDPLARRLFAAFVEAAYDHARR